MMLKRDDIRSRLTLFFSVFFVCFMTYIAGTRTIGADHDSLMYAYIINDSFSGNITSFLSKEPGFWIIVFFNKIIHGDVSSFFLIYAFIALCIKVSGMRKISPNFFISLILYVSFYFIVHEMMQIRIGLASGFIFFTFYYLAIQERFKAVFFSIAGIFFHYSTVIALLFFCIKPKKMISKIYLILPIIGVFLGLALQSNPTIAQSLFNIMPNFISYKASLYFDLAQSDNLSDVKSVAQGFGSIIYYCLMTFMFFRIKNKSLDDQYYRMLNLLLKITSIQLFLGFTLLFNVEFSNRIYTYIGVLTFTILPAYFINEFKQNSRFIIFMMITAYSIRQLYTSYMGVFG